VRVSDLSRRKKRTITKSFYIVELAGCRGEVRKGKGGVSSQCTRKRPLLFKRRSIVERKTGVGEIVEINVAKLTDSRKETISQGRKWGVGTECDY